MVDEKTGDRKSVLQIGRRACPHCRKRGLPLGNPAGACLACGAIPGQPAPPPPAHPVPAAIEAAVRERLCETCGAVIPKAVHDTVERYARRRFCCREHVRGPGTPQRRDDHGLTYRQQQLLNAMLIHPSVRAAAKVVGISENAASRMHRSEPFQRVFRALMEDQRESRQRRLIQMGDEALDELQRLLGDEDANIRLKAVVEVLKRIMPEKLEVQGQVSTGPIKITEIVVQLPMRTEEVIQGEYGGVREPASPWGGPEVVVEGDRGEEIRRDPHSSSSS